MNSGKLERKARWWWYTAIVLLPLIWFPYAYFPYEHLQVLWVRGWAVLGISILAWLWYYDVEVSWPKLPRWVWSVSIVFIVAVIASTFFSWSPAVAWWGSAYRFQGVSALVAYGVIGVVTYVLFPGKTGQRLFTALAVSGTAAAVYAFGQRLGLDPWAHPLRIHGSFGHPNSLAAFLMLSITATAGIIYWQKKYYSWFWLVFVLQWLVLWFTFTRSAWVATIGGIVCIALSYRRQRSGWLSGLMIVTMVFTFAVANVITTLTQEPTATPAAQVTTQPKAKKQNAKSSPATTALQERVNSTADPLSGSGSIRTYIWLDVVRVLEERWLFGAGNDNLQIRYPHYYRNDYTRPAIAKSTYADRAHNDVLDTWLNYGVIGLITKYILLITFVVACMRYVWRYRQDSAEFMIVATGGAMVLANLVFNQLGFAVTVTAVVMSMVIPIVLHQLTSVRRLRYTVSLGVPIAMMLIGTVVLVRWVGQPVAASVLAYTYNDADATSDAVVDHLTQAIQLEPYNERYHFLLANMLYAAVQAEPKAKVAKPLYGAAIEQAKQAHELGLIDLEYYAFMVKLYDARGKDYIETKQSFEERIRNEATYFGN